jgi:hypothetical protein
MTRPTSGSSLRHSNQLIVRMRGKASRVAWLKTCGGEEKQGRGDGEEGVDRAHRPCHGRVWCAAAPVVRWSRSAASSGVGRLGRMT